MPFRTDIVGSRHYRVEFCFVNGVEADAGCWIDGHWGQYGPDRLAEIVEGFGFEIDQDDDPRVWRRRAEAALEAGEGQWPGADEWQSHSECVDGLVDKLNEVTTEGYSWGWYDGEFFLWTQEQWEEDWA